MAEQKQYVKAGLATAAGLLALAGVVFSVDSWREQQFESPHYRADACHVCHVNATVGTNLVTQELELCTSCHEREGVVTVTNAEGNDIRVDLGSSHPWGIVPSARSMPLTLPLQGNKVTCQTCHDVHLSNSESHMLRLYTLQKNGKPSWNVLCLDCHVGY